MHPSMPLTRANSRFEPHPLCLSLLTPQSDRYSYYCRVSTVNQLIYEYLPNTQPMLSIRIGHRSRPMSLVSYSYTCPPTSSTTDNHIVVKHVSPPKCSYCALDPTELLFFFVHNATTDKALHSSCCGHPLSLSHLHPQRAPYPSPAALPLLFTPLSILVHW